MKEKLANQDLSIYSSQTITNAGMNHGNEWGT